jgi:hypothetical protein
MRDEEHKRYLGITSAVTFNRFLKDNIGKGWLKPQTNWLKNYKGEIPLDYIGKFESMEDTLNKIKIRLNLPEVEFPHELHGNSVDYRSEYDTESIEIVKKYYDEEIKLFNYTFDN